MDEAFYEHLASVMVSDPAAASDLSVKLSGDRYELMSRPQQSYRSFIYDYASWTNQAGQGRVTLLEEQVAIQAGTTGLRTWTARQAESYLIPAFAC